MPGVSAVCASGKRSFGMLWHWHWDCDAGSDNVWAFCGQQSLGLIDAMFQNHLMNLL